MSYHRLELFREQVRRLVPNSISAQDQFWRPMCTPSVSETTKLVSEMSWNQGLDSKDFDMAKMMELLNLDNEGTEDEESETESIEKVKKKKKGVESSKKPKAKTNTKRQSAPKAETSLQSAAKIAEPNPRRALPLGTFPTNRA